MTPGMARDSLGLFQTPVRNPQGAVRSLMCTPGVLVVTLSFSPSGWALDSVGVLPGPCSWPRDSRIKLGAPQLPLLQPGSHSLGVSFLHQRRLSPARLRACGHYSPEYVHPLLSCSLLCFESVIIFVSLSGSFWSPGLSFHLYLI